MHKRMCKPTEIIGFENVKIYMEHFQSCSIFTEQPIQRHNSSAFRLILKINPLFYHTLRLKSYHQLTVASLQVEQNI